MPYGYAGKILRVDLTTGTLTDIDSSEYLPEWVGGVGLGYRLLWEEIDENTTEWSPENTLIFAGGPCNGSPLPTAGRVEVIGIAPVGYPEPWACVSGAGGDFTPKLKWAGYDAVVITGKAETPKYIYINDDGAQLLYAEPIWGTGNYTTQEWFETKYGKDIASLSIGPAGENKCRIATITTNSENVMGQGGFGAVMGDKKIKAVCVKPGTHKTVWADPDEVLRVTKKISDEFGVGGANNSPIFQETEQYTMRRLSCPYSNCQASLHDCLYWFYNKVPAMWSSGSFSGTLGCAGGSAWTRQMESSLIPDRIRARLETHVMM